MLQGFLIDTNVLSELCRRQPDPRVLSWFEQLPADQLHISVLSLGELRKGIERLESGERRQRLERWLAQDLPLYFSGRLHPIDSAVAHRLGRMLAGMGRPLPAIDSLLAATALEHDLILVTRNIRDMPDQLLKIMNPWVEDPPTGSTPQRQPSSPAP